MGSDEVVIFSGHNGKTLLADVYVLHTDSGWLELRNGDTKMQCAAVAFPVYCDQGNERIVFGDYFSNTLCSMELPGCEVTEMAKLEFE